MSNYISQVELTKLPSFVSRLLQALAEAGWKENRLRSLLETHVTAECLQCHTRLGPEDLLDLAGASPAEGQEETRAARLRQGYCVRNDCRTYFYQFNLAPHPEVDWPRILDAASAMENAEAAQIAFDTRARQTKQFATRRRRVVTLLGGLGLILLALLVRQWVTGGPIPFLREPKKYSVDPASIERPNRR